ncbi:MAG: glycoside hydrolase family 9 protein, partial [Nannocystaceae bacterium]|nr:glycoside hydrolase family 9 protein [Nannocystaceae bacterium]
AVAAQASRVWKAHDPVFATRCLVAAERAFEAARTSDSRAPSESDTLGGLGYLDSDAGDEVFWASVELALATGKPKYIGLVTSSSWFNITPPNDGSGVPAIINWNMMLGPATLDLVMVEGPFTAEQLAPVRDMLRDTAEAYLEEVSRGGYRTTLQRQTYGASTTFNLLRNAIVLMHVFDFSKQPRFRSGALRSLEWILGRNPLGQVYVTGFGAQPVEHPHHGYWSGNPPPGMLVNGPNGDTTDPFASSQLRGRAQQKSYADTPEAISTNRVSDHGNAALAWVVTALAD